MRLQEIEAAEAGFSSIVWQIWLPLGDPRNFPLPYPTTAINTRRILPPKTLATS